MFLQFSIKCFYKVYIKKGFIVINVSGRWTKWTVDEVDYQSTLVLDKLDIRPLRPSGELLLK